MIDRSFVFKLKKVIKIWRVLNLLDGVAACTVYSEYAIAFIKLDTLTRTLHAMDPRFGQKHATSKLSNLLIIYALGASGVLAYFES